MTPEEKAKELIEDCRSDILIQHSTWNIMTNNSFPLPVRFAHQMALRCALMCVDQILKAINDRLDSSVEALSVEYWQQVKQAITQEP